MAYHTLGTFTGTTNDAPDKAEELNAAHQRIDELKSCLAEMLSIYWGDGDGIHPPPSCIQRAQAVLAETVQS